nr:MAG TPA: hypothetical protein [Caudoviricetes sp.]
MPLTQPFWTFASCLSPFQPPFIEIIKTFLDCRIILLKILSIIIKFKHRLILLLIIFPHQKQGDPHLARVELKLREASVWIRQPIPE